MPIRQVFLVQAFGDLTMVRRLIRDVVPHAVLVVVHVDKKTRRRASDSLAREFSDVPNVRVLRERRVWWAGFSQVTTTLSMVLLALRTCDFDYAHLLTASDIVVRDLSEFDSLPEVAAGADFIHVIPVPPHKSVRFRYYHLLKGDRVPRPRRYLYDLQRRAQRALGVARRPPRGLVPRTGSDWWTLKRTTLESLIAHPSVSRADRYFRFVDYPHEAYFQTLVASLPDANIVSSSLLRYIRWPGPKVLGIEDLPAIRASGAFFARKVHPAASAELIAQLPGAPIPILTPSLNRGLLWSVTEPKRVVKDRALRDDAIGRTLAGLLKRRLARRGLD